MQKKAKKMQKKCKKKSPKKPKKIAKKFFGGVSAPSGVSTFGGVCSRRGCGIPAYTEADTPC